MEASSSKVGNELSSESWQGHGWKTASVSILGPGWPFLWPCYCNELVSSTPRRWCETAGHSGNQSHPFPLCPFSPGLGVWSKAGSKTKVLEPSATHLRSQPFLPWALSQAPLPAPHHLSACASNITPPSFCGWGCPQPCQDALLDRVPSEATQRWHPALGSSPTGPAEIGALHQVTDVALLSRESQESSLGRHSLKHRHLHPVADALEVTKPTCGPLLCEFCPRGPTPPPALWSWLSGVQ